MGGGEDDFIDSLGNCLIEVGSLCFSVAVDGLVPIGYEVLAVALVDLTSKISSVIFVIIKGFWKSENKGEA